MIRHGEVDLDERCEGAKRSESGNRKSEIANVHFAICNLLFAISARHARPKASRPKSKRVTGAARFKTAHWGILIVETQTGETVYEHQADKLFAPASVTKLFSTAAALDALGADYRFRTPIYARGKIDEKGRLDGDLILVASGDPTLGGRTDSQGKIAFTDNDHIYAQFSGTAELTPQDPLAGLNELARQVAAKGVRRVGGEVRVDDRLFDHAESTGSGPNRVTPIMVNDNLLDVIVEPAVAGKPAKVRWRPETAAVQVDAAVQTVEKGDPRISIKAAERTSWSCGARSRSAASRSCGRTRWTTRPASPDRCSSKRCGGSGLKSRRRRWRGIRARRDCPTRRRTRE